MMSIPGGMAATAPEHDVPIDEALAIDAARDRPGAFDALARRYQVPLLRFLIRSTRHRHNAEDGLQETFRRLFAARRRFDLARRFRPWAFAVARRVAIDLANDRQRQRRVQPLDAAGVPAPENASGHLDQTEERMRVWELAREKLSPEQVRAFWLFHVEQMPAAEIAQVLGRSWVGVKTLLVRARRQLRGRLLTREREYDDTGAQR